MSRRGWLTVAVLILIGAGAAWHFTGRRARAAAPPQPVPVKTVAAKAQDVPVLLTGLGTVQALNEVSIKAQVNGTLIAIPAKEGQDVKTGDVIAEIDPSPYQAALDKAKAQLAEDQAQVTSAQADLQRYQTLAKRSFAPVQQVDDQRATVNKLNATVQADNAAIEAATIDLRNCVIHSPIDGRVGLYQVKPGNLIQSASQTGILTITQDHPIGVVFTLPEADLPRIQDGMAKGTLPVQVTGGDGTAKLADGQLETPNNTIDTTTGTIALKATFPNADDRLWPGEFVNASLQVTVLKQAVTLPVAAIQHGPDGTFVYKVAQDNTVQPQAVTQGYSTGDSAVITKGLNAGDTVVLSGQSRLSPGTHVAMVQDGPAKEAGGNS